MLVVGPPFLVGNLRNQIKIDKLSPERECVREEEREGAECMCVLGGCLCMGVCDAVRVRARARNSLRNN